MKPRIVPTKKEVISAIIETGYNRNEAAKILGLSRATFFRYAKKYRLVNKKPRLV